MKRGIKRFCVTILCVILILGQVPNIVFAENTMAEISDDENEIEKESLDENMTWSLSEDGTLTISGEGEIPNYGSDSGAPWYEFREQINTIVIQEGITNVGDYAFAGCSAEEVQIAESVNSIGNYAFSSCYKLQQLLIPGNVEWIEATAFDGCTTLREIGVEDNNTTYCSIDGVLFSADKSELIHYPANYSSTSYLIPDGTTTIAQMAFADCDTLEYLKIPSSLIVFDYETFRDCSKLISLGPVGSGCNIEYEWGKMIPARAFYGSQLENVIIEKDIVTIGAEAFEQCERITDVYYKGNETDWNQITFETENENLRSASIHLEDTTEGVISESTDVSETEKPVAEAMAELMPTPAPWGGSKEIDEPGDGTEEHPYKIENEMDFVEIIRQPDANYILAADFTISHNYYIEFTGMLNGNHHTITLNGEAARGLFQNNKGVIKNLNIEVNAQIELNEKDVNIGSISASNQGTIKNCTAKGGYTISYNSVSGYLCAGGITGTNMGKINGCWSGLEISVEGPYYNYSRGARTSILYVGGIAGESYGSIMDCLNSGSIKTNFSEALPVIKAGPIKYLVGGIAGCVDDGSRVVSCIQAGESIKMQGEFIGYSAGTQHYLYVGSWYNIQSGHIIGGENNYGNYSDINKIQIAKDCHIEENSMLQVDLYAVDYYCSAGGTYLASESSYENYNVEQIKEWWKNIARGEEEDVCVNKNVLYFYKWDAKKQIAYFGNLDVTGSQVTKETDTSFLSNVDNLVGKYVLVKTKSREDGFIAPDTLLSIKQIENKSGTVTAATENSITIDSRIYSTTLSQPKSYVGKFVLYHILEDDSVSVQTLEKTNGILTVWNAETGRLKIGAEYKLGEGAEQETLDFLGKTKYTSIMVQFLYDEYKNVYRITDKLDKDSDYAGPTYYETYIPPTEDEIILRDEFAEWEKAYDKYIDSSIKALQKFAQTDGEKREAVIAAEAKRMQKEDEKSNSKYLTGELGSYKTYCYKALAEYLYDHTCEKIDLSSIDLTSSSASTALIKAVARGMDGDKKKYEYGDIKITLNVLIVNSAKTGHLLVEKNGKTVVTAIVCSNRGEIEKSVSEYVNELKSLATNSVYNVSSAVYEDILGQSITKLTEKYVDQAVSKIERKFQVVLSEKFNSAGVGNLVKTLNECYSYYSYIKKNLKTEKLNDIEKVFNAIENLEFKDVTIKDAAVKKSVKALQKAKNSFLKAYEKHLEGTLAGNNKEHFKIYIKCPVDVEVYNSSGKLIGCASETELWYDDSIIITDIGEAKTITSLTDDLITFKVSSREDGTMDCTIEEFNENHEPIGRLNYYDIVLSQKQEYGATLMNDLSKNRDKLTINADNEVITADEYISAEDPARVVVSCSVEAENGEEGGKVRGIGTYIRGNAVVLYADPDDGYVFEGWYQGENIVSLSEIYEFTAQEDEFLTAKFVHDERVDVVVNVEEGGYITGAGKYFKEENVVVKAVPEDTYQFAGWYVENKKISDDIEYVFAATEDIIITAKFKTSSSKTDGKWIKSGSRWWYQYANGSYPAGILCKIGNNWYGFNQSGWMQTGWAVYNKKWYYFSKSGVMQTGWLTEQGNTYYLESDGKMAVGWKKIDKYWYYLNSDGTRATGWKYVNKDWYYLNSSGKMFTGFITMGNSKYYMDENGKMKTGWQKVNNAWRYFQKNGKMAVGWQKIDQYWYYLNSDGARATGWKYVNKDWYYLNSNGRMFIGFITIGNEKYYMDENGKMKTGWQKVSNVWRYFKENGKMVIGWQKTDGKWYYLDYSGARATGWRWVNKKWYYLTENGSMQTGWKKIKENWYYFQSNGAMLEEGWHKIGNHYYYMYSSGIMASNTWIGKDYVNASGAWCYTKGKEIKANAVKRNANYYSLYPDSTTSSMGSFSILPK